MLPLLATGVEKRWARSTRGFTLIELVVVVAMLIILTGIVAPRLPVSPTRRVEGRAHQMVAHLELARSHALGRRQMTRVIFDEMASTYTAYVDDDRNDAITEIAAEVSAFPAFGVRELGNFVQYGRGNALAVPGDSLGIAVSLTNNKLNLSVQGVPEPWGTMGTVYLVHRDDKDAVAAISIASSGSFKAWRWWPDPGEWR